MITHKHLGLTKNLKNAPRNFDKSSGEICITQILISNVFTVMTLSQVITGMRHFNGLLMKDMKDNGSREALMALTDLLGLIL